MSTNSRSHARAGWTLGLALALLVVSSPFAAEKVRPAEWAVPVHLEGVPNLHRITPDLYRSAQPKQQGFRNLTQLGIQTLVNLRDGDHDNRAALEVGFRLELVPLSALHIRPESNLRILRLLGQAERGPTLVHCQHGADRTGMICALYRMVYQGWDRGKAIEEMRKGGYGFHSIYRGLVRYLEDVDVEALRKQMKERGNEHIQSMPSRGRPGDGDRRASRGPDVQSETPREGHVLPDGVGVRPADFAGRIADRLLARLR